MSASLEQAALPATSGVVGQTSPMKGFVVVLVVERDTDDRDAVARVCHEFDAATLGDLEVAVELASKSAKRQLRHTRSAFAQERQVRARRAAIRPA